MEIHNQKLVNGLDGLLDRLDRAGRTGRTGRAGEAMGSRETGETAGLRGDGLEVSARAREITALRGVLGGLPDVRVGLVACLREEIAGGLYRTDGRQIADAMLEEERAFAARVGPRRW
jgi:flagellar biosynthesis anti-sigma factor FlgM